MENNLPINNDDEISFKELLYKVKEWHIYFFSQWKIIFIAGIIGSALGLTYSVIKKPVYIATLSFAMEDEKSGGGLGSALGLASSFGLDLGGSGGGMFSGSNLAELFKSRSMVEKTLLSPINVDGKVISLAEMYIQNNKWRKSWDDNSKLTSLKFLPNSNREKFTRIQDSIMGVMYQKLSEGLSVAQKDKKISIINIDVSSTNELFAKFFCESLAKQVSNFYVDVKSKKARINMNILEKQVDSIRGELNNSIGRVAVANDKTFNLNPALNIRRAPAARSQIDVQANTAIFTELVKQSELAKVNLRKETPLIQIIDKPILPLERERLGKIKGVFIGGLLFAFVSIVILIFKKIFKNII